MTNWDIFYSSSTTDSEEAVSDVLALSLNGEKHRVELSPPLQISFTHPKHVGYTHFKSLRFFYVSNVEVEMFYFSNILLLNIVAALHLVSGNLNKQERYFSDLSQLNP